MLMAWTEVPVLGLSFLVDPSTPEYICIHLLSSETPKPKMVCLFDSFELVPEQQEPLSLKPLLRLAVA